LSSGAQPLKWLGVAIGALVAIFVVIWFFSWVTAFKGTDVGQICVVREGGLFDGRDIAYVRQPGEGVKNIGTWNHQDCLPATERDSNDVLEKDPQFPTRDGVLLTADAQVLFSLTRDESKVKQFYKSYGRRKWGDAQMTTDAGWLNFLRERFAPVVLDAYRETIGEYDCVQLNNLCQYVLDPTRVATEGKVDEANNDQNLAEAQTKIQETLKARLRAAFGDDYFENVRVQNLRVRFEPDVQAQITQAQAKRAEVAKAKLEADRQVEVAEGQRRAAKELAEARIEAKRGYDNNPVQADIDKIKAFCGDDGCDPKVVGGGDVITSITGGK
jgi:hypothetical protein